MAAAIIANKLQKKRGYYGNKTTKEIVRIKIDAGSEVCESYLTYFGAQVESS
jgi:hypothetical protein